MINRKELIWLNSRFSVTVEFFIRVFMAIEDNQKNLLKDVPYKSVKLCCNGFWSGLSDGERRLAGMCISEMEKYGLINLREVRGLHEYPKFYELK